MNSGLVLTVAGAFLLGGAWSVWSAGGDPEVKAAGRSGVRVAFAVVLLLAALLATAAGILRLV